MILMCGLRIFAGANLSCTFLQASAVAAVGLRACQRSTYSQSEKVPTGKTVPRRRNYINQGIRYAGEEPSSSLRSRKVDQDLGPKSLISHVGLLHAGFCVA